MQCCSHFYRAQCSGFFFPFIEVNLAEFSEMLFTLCALQRALCDVCDSPHSDEEDEGEEEATQRHSTADERQHLQSVFALWTPLTSTHMRTHTEREL